METLKLFAQSTMVQVDSSSQAGVDLGISAKTSSGGDIPSDLEWRINIIDATANESWVTDIKFSSYLSCSIEKNEATSSRTSSVTLKANFEVFNEETQLWEEQPEQSCSVSILQEPYMPPIEIPLPPENPPVDDDEAEKEMEENVKLSEKIRDEVDKLISAVWAELLQMGQDFIDTWTKKLYDVICKITAQVGNELAVRKSAIYEAVNRCIKIAELTKKIDKELKKQASIRDTIMIENWTAKIEACKEEIEEILQEQIESHTLKESGANKIREFTSEKDTNVLVEWLDKSLESFCNSEYEEGADDLKQNLYNILNGQCIGKLIEQKFNELKNNGRVLYNGVKEMVSSAVTSVTEPMGAVIVTPMGPGACATNLMQIRGTIKRVQSQAVALVPVIAAMIDAAIFLRLSPNLIQTLVGISATLTIVGTIKIP